MNKRSAYSGCNMVRPTHHNTLHAFTYIELMIALAIASAILLGLSGVVGQTLHKGTTVHAKNTITRDAHFAMAQMTTAVQKTYYLILPLNDNLDTNWPENIREQTYPASPPVGDSTLATAVLAVTLAHDIDIDQNGTPDADNDGDGLFDEDLPDDSQFDAAPGLYLIDDGGDGSIDEGSNNGDDDERLFSAGEDPIDGIDNDSDSNIDEDPAADMNGDGCPGICGVDDDSDSTIDEGSIDDDDEDGTTDEDWYDPVVFYLIDDFYGTSKQLVKRTPVPWDESADGGISGRDYIISVIADNVTRFRVERLVATVGSPQLIDITLEITSPDTGEVFSLNTLVRVGGAL